jgi:NAD(P)-dependent dehydrogenase (short-subunit alcohol dehydrogenase family)
MSEPGPAKRVALVTGAGSGVGRAVALALLKAGYHVALAGRREDALRETAARKDAGAERTLVVPTDVSDPASVRNLFAKTQQAFGRLDLLFNNAGINVPATPLEELKVDDWKRVVDINLTGLFLCTQEAFRLMKSQTPMGGRIINNGSISAQVPRPNSAAYTASKHGVAGLTKSTALEGRHYNIACGQVDIGNAETEMAAKMKTGMLQASGEFKPEPLMDVQCVADSVLAMARLPLEANILFLTVMATKMPFVGRG